MKKISITLLLMLILNGLVYAQSAFKVTVLDNNGKTVAGAYLHLLNTNHEGYADAKGVLELKSIQAGDYILLVRSPSFNSVTKEVKIASGAVPALIVELMPDSKELETVIVTAQKTEEAVQSLPVSVSVLNARTVDAFRLWQARDLSGLVPNLYAANPGDGRNVIAIRGITSTSYDPAVATYIDGVSQFSLDTYIPQLFDVERIEILRGPQGTLYGRNAMGGVINVVSKQPSNKAEGFAEVSYGNFNTGRYAAGVRLPLVKNKLFFGVTGLYEHTDGYYTNDFYGSAFDKQHAAGAGYVLKYLPSGKWKMTLNVKHLATRNNGAFPLAGSVNDALTDPYKVNQDAVTQLVDNTLNASLSVQYFSGKWNLASQTAYQSNYRYYRSPIDADFSPADGITIINNYGTEWNRVKTLTQEFRFTTIKANSKLKWTGGLFFFHQQSPARQATHFGEDAMLVGSPDINYAVIGTTRNDNKGLAMYAQTGYQLQSHLQLIAGIRYDYQRSRSNILGEYLPDGAPAPVFETRPDTTATADYGAYSPKLGLNLQISGRNSLYITFSRGYRTGGLTPFSPDPSQPPLYAYKPEHSNMVELGSKNMFLDNALRLNLALFYSTITDAQVPTLVLPEAITLIRNAGKLISKGIEAELAAVVVKGLEVSYNFGYTHARYNTLKLSSAGTEVDLKGNRQIFTPDITSMLALQHSLYIDRRSNIKLITRGEWSCAGVTYFDFANTARQPSYHLLNARAGLAMHHLELMGWIRNITDTKYIAYAYDFGATHLGRPRSYGVTVKYSF